MGAYSEQAKSLLTGAFDLHVHTGLDFRRRSVDDIEVLREADRYHMAGVILKNHYEPTQARAYLANKYAGVETVAYGSVCLNSTVGGINVYAVENALRQGAKLVWMPTMDSTVSTRLNLGQQFDVRKSVPMYTEGGRIRKEIYQVFDLVKQYDVFIASGHLDQKETLDFCDAALAESAKVIMTHPDWARSRIPDSIQKEYANKGVLIEKVFWNLPPQQMCRSVMGFEKGQVFIVTDRGQPDQKTPTFAMLEYVEDMLDYGLSEKEIKGLIVDVPKNVLGIG